MPESKLPAPHASATHDGAEAGHHEWMQRGTLLHAAGQPEQALAAFEKARSMDPLNVNTASACAAMLSQLDRPVAAYRTLLAVEDQLVKTADGAANLAITAEACGDLVKANAAYTLALQFDPAHLRSLNNVGFLAASASQWDLAISLAQQCVALQPGHAPHHANLAEYFSGSCRYAEALKVVTSALALFPHDADLKIRQIALLAFEGELAIADAAITTLDAQGRQALEDFLLKLEPAGRLRPRAGDSGRPAFEVRDALQVYISQALRNLQLCDWRSNEKLVSAIRFSLQSRGAANSRDWGDAPFYGLMLGLSVDELAQMRRESIRAMADSLHALAPSLQPFRQPPVDTGNRIKVGISVHDLGDERQLRSLEQQLAHHDASRFAIHVYAFSPHPEVNLGDRLRPFAVSVNELVHMTDVDAAARIRLDHLDIYIEAAVDSPWSLPEIATLRVAAVQLHQPALDDRPVPGPWEYSVSDLLLHPGTVDASRPAIVRLPATCWLAGTSDAASAFKSREEAALPADVLLLCSLSAPLTLDPQTFSVWMKVLRALPDALLWLPHCARAAGNLVREARAAGVSHSRLIFSAAMSHADLLGRLQHADILLDNLRLGSATGIEDALLAGVPAISCAGDTMASRLSGSILRAASLPECVLSDPQAYVAEAIRLGRNPDALVALRARVQAARTGAALFDLTARVRDWEAAWTVMVERSRAGLAPTAFDVAAPADTSLLLNK